MLNLRRALCAIASCCLLLLSLGAFAQSPADVAAARELFKEGVALSKQGKWQAARDKLERSLSLKRARSSLYSLAVAEMSSGAPLAAMEHFRAFLAEPSTPKTRRFEEPARVAIEELDKRIARVSIRLQPAGVDDVVVTLDDEVVPAAVLDRPRLLDPGEHLLTAQAPGYAQARSAFEVGEGERTEVTLELVARPQSDADPSPTPSPEPEVGGDKPPFPTLPVALMAGGGTVFAVGLIVGILGYTEAGDAPASEGDDADSAMTKAIAADVVMGVGAVAVGVGLVLLLVTDDGDEAAAAASVRPWSNGPTAGVEVRF